MQKRSIISNGISVLESGTFQDFCLEFFRIREKSLSRLKRFGGTNEGKTRPGHPDLIQTNSDGTQVCVECSTQDTYFALKKDLTKCKPISDVDSCAQHLSDIKKIYLCCSKELPTTNPNIESVIIKYCRENYPFEVEIWSNADFESPIKESPLEYKQIICDYLPESFRPLFDISDSATASATLDIMQKHDLSLAKAQHAISKISEQFGSLSIGDDEIRNVVESISKPRFTISLPKVELLRNENWESIFGGLPLGQIVVMRGVPKIGKTSLIASLCSDAKTANFISKVLWFHCPRSITDQERFSELRQLVDEIILHIFRNYFTAQSIMDYLSNQISFEDLQYNAESKTDKTISVIDNAEYFPIQTLNYFRDHFSKISNLLMEKENVGMIFISSKSLKGQLGEACSEYRHPDWKDNDLEQYLILNDIINLDEPYFKLLCTIAQRHPRLMLAIARKFKTLGELLDENLNFDLKSIGEGDLQSEIKDFIFSDVCADDSNRDFIIRISPLKFKFAIGELEHLCKAVQPPIRKSVKLMIEELYGTIIEGDPDGNLTIADIFRKIGEGYSSDAQKKEIYQAIAAYIFTPINGKVDGLKACDAIFYLIGAGNHTAALTNAGTILASLTIQNVDIPSIRYILNNLESLRLWDFPEERNVLGPYLSLMYTFAMLYSRIREPEESKKSLAKLNEGINFGVKRNIISEQDIEYFSYFTISIRCYNGIVSNNLEEAIKPINELSMAKGQIFDAVADTCIQLLIFIIPHVRYELIPIDKVIEITNVTSAENEIRIDKIISIYDHIGVHLHANNIDISEWSKSYNLKSGLSKILFNITLSQYKSQKNNIDDAIEYANEGIKQLGKYGCKSEFIKRHFNLLMADCYYKDNNIEKAKSIYAEIKEEFIGDNPFGYGWCLYRLARFEEDLDTAFEYFTIAEESFNKSFRWGQFARCMGEKAIIRLLQKRNIDAIELFRIIIEEYYISSEDEFGPTAMVAMNIMANLVMHDKPREEDWTNNFGGLQFGVRRNVFLGISNTVKPRAGLGAPFWFLYELYRKEKLFNKSKECEPYILEADLVNPAEMGGYVTVIRNKCMSIQDMAIKHVDGLKKIVDNEAELDRIKDYGFALLFVWSTTKIREFRYNDYWQSIFDKIYFISRAQTDVENKSASVLYVLLKSTGKTSESDFQNIVTHCKPIYEKLVENLDDEERKYFN